jgi:hypothetical protein
MGLKRLDPSGYDTVIKEQQCLSKDKTEENKNEIGNRYGFLRRVVRLSDYKDGLFWPISQFLF